MDPVPSQPWYTSKTLWALVLMFTFNVLQHFSLISATSNVQFLADSVLSVLALVFRWQSDQPLTLKGGVKLSPPSG
jgi:hypothetical protein